MVFLANRANLDARTLLTRIYNRFQTQVSADGSPIEQVWYHTSAGNKTGVRATVATATFLGTSHPVDTAELQISFDFPSNHGHDFYQIQWVESKREFMLGWHQDETHPELGKCHFQIDHQGKTIQRSQAEFLDIHPLNVLDQRIDDLVDSLDAITWGDGRPTVPEQVVR